MICNIAINGFGRIGRSFLRSILKSFEEKDRIVVKAINIGPCSTENIDLLLKYDSVYETLSRSVFFENNTLIIDNYPPIIILSEPDPQKLNWKHFNLNWVIECSGQLCSKEKSMYHCKAGAEKVLISAPCPDADVTIVPGINDKAYDAKKHTVISLGSCTTNCFAQLIKTIHQKFTLISGLMTTIHAYTNNQRLLDSDHKDPRRGRAAALNIIPTNTGAEKVITYLFPDLQGKIQAQALRIPVANISLVDFSFTSQENLTAELINQAFKESSQINPYLEYNEKPLVSSDFIGNKHSAIFDATLTHSTYGQGKICAWYDNEYGYASRMKDFLLHNS